MGEYMSDCAKNILSKLHGARCLDLAYIGIVNHLFTALRAQGSAEAGELASKTGCDPDYVVRWCEAAYAFELLESQDGKRFSLSPLGARFCPDASDTLMPVAVQAVLGTHIAERAACLMESGERPGEQVLTERKTVLPWFGPMLERQFVPLLEQEILPAVSAITEVGTRGGLVVDLGCGNGWYLRTLAKRFVHLRGLGLDGMGENIEQARHLAAKAGLEARLCFETGDIHEFRTAEPVDLIAMNRALHHVWDRREEVFTALREYLSPGGVAVIWEPNWPADPLSLRDPDWRTMAFQNLVEHVQGNHFVSADLIAQAFREVDMEPQVHLFQKGREAVVVGRRPG